MTLSAEQAQWFRAGFTDMADNMGQALLGKDHTIFALVNGTVKFATKANGRTYISVHPMVAAE